MSFTFCICFEFIASIEFNFQTIMFENQLFNMDQSNLFLNIQDLKEFDFIFSIIKHSGICPKTINDVYAKVVMSNYVLFLCFSFSQKCFFHFYKHEYRGVSTLLLYSKNTFSLLSSCFFFFKMIRFELIFAFLLKHYCDFYIIFAVIFPIIAFCCYFCLNYQNYRFLKLLNFFFFQDIHFLLYYIYHFTINYLDFIDNPHSLFFSKCLGKNHFNFFENLY